MEGLHCEPSERGQHEVVHDGRHDLTTHSVLYFCHVVVDKETEVKQEHGCHELDENPCGFTGLGPPVGRDEQIKKNYANFKLCAFTFIITHLATTQFLDAK